MAKGETDFSGDLRLIKSRSAAFIVWNEFQISHFAPIFESIGDAIFIILSKSYNRDLPSIPALKEGGYRYRVIMDSQASSLDGLFDFIFFQSPFPGIHEFSKSKLISLQYGMAKEAHNYGVWRALADLNLTYGKYSRDVISNYSPSLSIGHPRHARYIGGVPAERPFECRQEVAEKKTVLFMPTWGNLGSSDTLLPQLAKLQDRFNLFYKYHHNELTNGLDIKSDISDSYEIPSDNIFGPESDAFDLISKSDMVISDFSGAIFDAILLEKPVLLFQEEILKKVGLQKFDLSSIEYLRREDLGLVCTSVANITRDIDIVLSDPQKYVALAAELRNDIFDIRAEKEQMHLISQACDDLISGRIARTDVQMSLYKFIKSKYSVSISTNSKILIDTCNRAIVFFVLLAFLQGGRRNKLLREPEAFFRDSKSRLVRLLGRFARF